MPINGPDRLTRRDIWIVAVASAEQIIGAAISTVVGVMLPMMKLLRPEGHEMSSLLQGFIGACGLIGIAIGGMTIGHYSDRQGYLRWFRACPLIIVAGALVVWLGHSTGALIAGLLIMGVGTGGGYSLDSAYISELMPTRFKGVMVGVAKASSSLGFISAAFIAWGWLKADPDPRLWPALILIVGAMALITALCRITWWESPRWLLDHGRAQEAGQAGAHFFPCTRCEAPGAGQSEAPDPAGGSTRLPLAKVIYSGIPWACEGMGVYGFGVFLPVLVMALGIESSSATGMHRVTNSVLVTGLVNTAILPGFVIGLLLVRRLNHVRMLSWGFAGAASGLGLLLAAFLLHWPSWVMVAGFIIFELALNAGPHLITYIIPSRIYPVAERGTGTGVASSMGKAGGIIGVMVMPFLLKAGGMTLVLAMSITVMLAGGIIGAIYGRKLGLTR